MAQTLVAIGAAGNLDDRQGADWFVRLAVERMRTWALRSSPSATD